jgi:hypothetical protein
MTHTTRCFVKNPLFALEVRARAFTACGNDVLGLSVGGWGFTPNTKLPGIKGA